MRRKFTCLNLQDLHVHKSLFSIGKHTCHVYSICTQLLTPAGAAHELMSTAGHVSVFTRTNANVHSTYLCVRLEQQRSRQRLIHVDGDEYPIVDLG